MKKATMFMMMAVLVCTTSLSYAQTIKLGCVNTEEFMSTYPDAKKAQETLEAFQKEVQSTFETMVNEGRLKYEDYQKNQSTFSDLVKQQKEKEIMDIQNRLEQFNESTKQDISKKQMELFGPITEKVTAALNKVAKEGNFTIIIDTAPGASAFLYMDQSQMTDITPMLKAGLGLQ